MSRLGSFTHGIREVELGVQLHYVQTGDGPTTLVLLHGYPETWWQWRHTMPLFAEADYRVIAVDYRGAGNSSKPADGYDKRMMARDIRTLLVARIGVAQPICLVGHDIGMAVAFAYAAQYPDEVHKLVLVDAIIPGTEPFQRSLTTGKLKNSTWLTSSFTMLGTIRLKCSRRVENVHTSRTSSTAWRSTSVLSRPRLLIPMPQPMQPQEQ